MSRSLANLKRGGFHNGKGRRGRSGPRQMTENQLANLKLGGFHRMDPEKARAIQKRGGKSHSVAWMRKISELGPPPPKGRNSGSLTSERARYYNAKRWNRPDYSKIETLAERLALD